MINTFKVGFSILVCFTLLSLGTMAFAYQNPTVSAGPDLYITSGQTIVLQGSGYDPNGYSLTYSWSCTGGSLSNYNIAQPIYTATNYNYQTNQTCTLTGTNIYGNTASDSVIVYADNNSNSIQTTYATSVSDYQANLNGTLSNIISSQTNSAYFQWGTTGSYGNETPRQTIGYNGNFFQNITNLNPNTIYHYRAVAQNNYGTIYGQDITFTTTGSGYYGNNILSINKKVINLTSRNTVWASSVNANPSDILSFSITIQAINQNIHNVTVRDIIPANLIYRGNLMIGTSNYIGDITYGINIGTVYTNQPVIISYQAQVASADNFSYGVNTIYSNTTLSSNETSTQTNTATVMVNRSVVYGVTTVSTGLTNNILTDSFFLPLLLILLMAWLYSSGMAYKFAERFRKINK